MPIRALQRHLHLFHGRRGSLEGPVDHLVRREAPAGADGTLRVLSLNVRHGRGWRPRPGRLGARDFRAHARLIADFLRTEPADVVALQEADAPSSWSGSFHHGERLLDLLGVAELAHGRHFRLEASPVELHYGTALLSRIALREVEARAFRARPVDTKGYVVAETTLSGRPLDVASIHLDVLPTARRRQVVETIRRLRRRGRPLVLMGDLNSTGRAARGAVRKLASHLGLRVCETDDGGTFPVRRPTRRLDWILASKELECRTCRHLDHSVSDHRAVAAEIAWKEGEAP